MAQKSKDTPPNENGWNRWRGEVDTRLDYLCGGQAEQKESLSRVEGALQQLVSKSEEKQEKVHKELDDRVKSLENFSTTFKTKVALVSGVAGIFGGSASTVLLNYVVKKVLGG